MKKIVNLIMFLVPTFTLFYTILFNHFEKYDLLFLMPLTYTICYFGFLKKFLFAKFSFFRVTFIIILFLRYVILPLLIVVSNYDNIVSIYKPTIYQTRIAILLMVYEIIAYSFFIWIYPKLKKDKTREKTIKKYIDINYTNPIFIIFCIIAISLLMLTPGVINYFNFITVSKDFNSLDLSTTEEITILFVACAKGIIFLILLNYLSKKYKRNNNKLYYYLGLLVTIINSCIYYGSNRSTFIFIAIASFATFYAFYRKGLKQMALIMSTIIFIILPIITTYRNYYDYYSDLSGMQKTLVSSQGTINEYFGGINNVAVGLETANEYQDKRTMSNLLFDFTRPVIGLNIFLKNIDMEYSNLFFNHCYHKSDLVSVIFPTISQGYFYFGFFGAPLLGILLIYIALKLEEYCINLSNPYLVYFFTPSLLRLATLTGPNVNIQMNDLSLKILAPILLLLLYKGITKRENRKQLINA